MLTNAISRICGSHDMMEPQNSCSDGAPRLVVRERVVPFGELGVGHRGGVDHRLIVTEHHGRMFDVHSKIAEGIAQSDDLLCAKAGGNVFGTKCSGLNRGLKLREEVNHCLVGQVDDTSDRAATDKIMVQIGIDERSEDHSFATGRGHVIRYLFSSTAVN